jgi:hypothetical protein
MKELECWCIDDRKKLVMSEKNLSHLMKRTSIPFRNCSGNSNCYGHWADQQGNQKEKEEQKLHQQPVQGQQGSTPVYYFPFHSFLSSAETS